MMKWVMKGCFIGLLLVWATQGFAIITEQDRGISYEEGLVALYHFNENNDTFAHDVTGTNTGTILEAIWTSGKFGSSLQFDGINDNVDCGDNPTLRCTKAITIEAWVKYNADNPGEWPYIVGKYHNYELLSSPTYRMSGAIFIGSVREPTPSFTATQGVWYHTVVTYDMYGGADNVRLYIDGDVFSTVTATGEIDTGTYSLTIGAITPVSGECFNGIVDEVRIYNRVLTPDEVKAHAQTICSEIYDNFLPRKCKVIWSPTSGITIKVRSGSDTPTLLSSSWVTVPSSGSLVDLQQYIQYQVGFASTAVCLSSLQIMPTVQFVKSVAFTPTPPIRAGALTFDIYFTEAMDPGNTPTLYIITQAGNTYSSGQAGWSGQWLDGNQQYRITYDNITVGMNGFASVRISGATSQASGDTMSVYEEEGTLLIDTKRLIQTSSIEFFPNPFSPNGDGICESTMLINLPSLQETTHVAVKIYNLKGGLIRTLLDEECQSGAITVEIWNGKDNAGKISPIGLYLYQVRIGEEVKTGTVVLAK